ncbi:uncharacterized protein TOL2_C36670 [Desulfobacula toluolica Tol2]|uniref:Uncharacterized protein n=2 Tax=Desulfobacula toluolica TaxID=28223 RepID=K0NNZ9_DESTT|nr:uncharacterized protein TOL2_C36670 [Desulfobacula toluolica Tol2]
MISFSLAVKQSGPVFLIEAHPKIFKCLKKTCEYNGLKNFVPFNIAVVDADKEVFLGEAIYHYCNSLKT